MRTCEFEHLGGEVLEDGGRVHGGLRADAHVVLCALLEVAVDTAYGELWFCARSNRSVVRNYLTVACP